jgi:murein DD-endopeptidase MepM/ murein hydrolase activator NlpD
MDARRYSLAFAALVALAPAARAARTVAAAASAEAPPRPTGAEGCPRGQLDVEGHCLPAPRCGLGEFELDGVCVAWAGDGLDATDNPLATNVHVDRLGRRVVYEHLPRRPDLPADYGRYVYPVPPRSNGQTVTSGYDLDLPDAQQRRGAGLSAVGHGGVDLPNDRGTPVSVVRLRGEVDDPQVLYVGWLFGNTVVLRHVVRDAAGTRTYLTLHGHLDATAPGLVRGAAVAEGAPLGAMGDSGADGVIHLHYEVRLVRTGVDPRRVEAGRLTDQAVSVPCDPRNVLPFR